MSIYGAMFSGISGLQAQSQALGAIADNISNVNTIGYKTTDTNFKTLVTQSATTNSYTPGGVISAPRALIDRQGLLQASNSPTDISISGNGFFVVNDLADTSQSGATYLYTRAGSFVPDENGNLKNTAGFYLQGWEIQSDGSITTNQNELSALQTVNIRNLTGTAEATTQVSIKANLQSSEVPGSVAYDPVADIGNIANGTTPPLFERSVQVYDSQGTARTLTMGFYREDVTPTPSNTWNVEIYMNPPTDLDPGSDISASGTDGVVASGTVAFNGDGTLIADPVYSTLLDANGNAVLNFELNPVDVDPLAPPPALRAPMDITINFGSDGMTDGFTQFDAPSVLVSSDSNGSVFGALAGVRVDEDGTVVALFDNGTRQNIYKLPVAMFNNPSGLIAKTGNTWIASAESGDFNLQQATQGGAGSIAPGTLEASTVDLATEFTKMITTQQAYSASSRIITTADEMLDELLRLKR
jgi:flagellar hook protein FlgE